MMINVKMMKPEAYRTLQANKDKILELIKSHPDSGDWLAQYLEYDPYEVTTYEIEDFVLQYDKDYETYSVYNGIVLYEALKDLPARILYSTYFWAWINFEKAYRQAIQSVKISNSQKLENGWFPKLHGRRQIMLGAMSREFIKVKMTVDESSDDKYSLTKYLFGDKSLYIMMMARNITDNYEVTHAILDIVKIVYDKNGIFLTHLQSNALLKIAFNIGSVMLVDSLSREEIRSILLEEFEPLYPDLFN